MKTVLQYLGIFLFIAAIAVLVYTTTTELSNSLLSTSAILLIVGLILHVIFNKKIE